MLGVRHQLQFLGDSKQLPAAFNIGNGMLRWEGSVESPFTGVHKFRFTYAGYLKIWRWQSWWPTAGIRHGTLMWPDKPADGKAANMPLRLSGSPMAVSLISPP